MALNALDSMEGSPLAYEVAVEVTGSDFDPRAVTELLGVEPTDTEAGNEGRGRLRPSRWSKELSDAPSEDLEGLLDAACSLLEASHDRLRGFVETSHANLRITVLAAVAVTIGPGDGADTEVVMYGASARSIPPELLGRLSRLQANLWFRFDPWIDEIRPHHRPIKR